MESNHSTGYYLQGIYVEMFTKFQKIPFFVLRVVHNSTKSLIVV